MPIWKPVWSVQRPHTYFIWQRRIAASKTSGYLAQVLGRASATAALADFRTLPGNEETKPDDRGEISQIWRKLWCRYNDQRQVQKESHWWTRISSRETKYQTAIISLNVQSPVSYRFCRRMFTSLRRTTDVSGQQEPKHTTYMGDAPTNHKPSVR